MNQCKFKLILKEKIYDILPSKILMDMSPNIMNSLIFDPQHQYQIESNISEEVFECFIQFITKGDVPCIDMDNINEYISLSEEFNILSDIIEEKKKEFGEYLVNINGLQKQDYKLPQYEREIARNLDEYLFKYGQKLMKTRIQTLYNIFNHKERKLTQHDLAYELINKKFLETNDSSILILFDTLDCSKLAQNHLLEAFEMSEERFNHMPKLDFVYLSNILNRQEKLEEKFFAIEKKCIEQDEKMQFERQNLEEKLLNIDKIREECSNDDETKIWQQRFEERLSEIERKFPQELQSKLENDQQKLSENIMIIDNKIEQYSKDQERKINVKHQEFDKRLFALEAKIIEQDELMIIQQQKFDERLSVIESKFVEQEEKMKIQQERLTQKYLKCIEDLQEQIENLHQMVDFNLKSDRKKIKSIEKANLEEKEALYATIKQLKERIKEVERNNDIQNLDKSFKESKSPKREKKVTFGPSFRQSLIANVGMNTPGILYKLKSLQKSSFDRYFIASQSSGDIYNLINPFTEDYFLITKINDFIEIEFEEAVLINGIQIFSAASHFPRSFDIEINDKFRISIEDAGELNGKDRRMTINVDPIQCIKCKFINKATNWNINSESILIKRIEFTSPSNQFQRGVFTTLVSQSEGFDPHKCPVIISASKYDFNNFHLIDACSHISTLPKDNSWFQVEFTRGIVLIVGFRLIKCRKGKLKSFKIICTDDVSKPEEDWSKLIEINDNSLCWNEKQGFIEFPQSSPPARFVRIVQTGPNWDNEMFLKFYHLDFFGSYT